MDDTAISRFWEKYVDKTARYKIKPAAAKWYVRHAQQYITAHADRRLSTHHASDVEQYLRDKGRAPSLTDWQFQQAVKSLQIQEMGTRIIPDTFPSSNVNLSTLPAP